MRMTSALLAAGACAMAANSALAADLGPYRPAPPPSYNEGTAPRPFSWTGLYMGANIGYGWGGGDSVGVTDGAGFQGSAGTLATDGAFGGAQFGYNYQAGRIVLGVEADIQASDLNDQLTGVTSGGYGVTASSDINAFGTVRGRLGYAMGPALLYATGGWAWADVDYKFAASNGINAVALTDSDFKTGYTLGAGLEYAIAPGWTTKIEYQYIDLGKYNLSAGGISTNENFDFHTVRMGLNHKF